MELIKNKVLVVFGTRPEAIKLAPLINLIKKNKERFDLTVCVTAQHRDMLDQVLRIFNIIPDIDLNLMKENQNLIDITSNVLLSMNKVVNDLKPDIVLVHGDTTTTFATSLACFYNNIKVGHIEAGLRTFNLSAPYPEEFNRKVTAILSYINFAPTNMSKMNLIREGYAESKIVVTGNTVIDALFLVLKNIEKDPIKKESIVSFLDKKLSFSWREVPYVVITGHRRENFGQSLIQICSAIRDLANTYQDKHFIYPVHLNPNVIKPVKNLLSNIPNISLIEPLEYEVFAYLIKYSFFIMTDSGGIQEEAPSLGKPVLLMRENTERPEGLEAGTVKLVGSSRKNIVKYASRLFEDESFYKKMSKAKNPYGDGHASEKILSFLESN